MKVRMSIQSSRSPLVRFEGPIISALAVAGAGVIAAMLLELGPLAGHMAAHIATMNILAPLVAVGMGALGWLRADFGRPPALWSATLVQMAVLWGWHSPAIQHASHTSLVLALALHSALLLAALAFWVAIVAGSSNRWQAILALLLSGKLACLIGALLVFSPRLLYLAPANTHSGHSDTGAALADQHLAGLLMLAACPLSYILAAIVLTAQEITKLQTQQPQIGRDRHAVGG